MHIFPSIPEEDFEGYIFDCDGTLANSMPIHFESWCYALNKHGAKFEFTWDLFYSMAGMGINHSIERFNEKFNLTLNSDALIIDIKEFVHGNLHRIEPMVEVVELARRLSKVRPTSVASGGPRVVVHKVLEIIKANDIFPHVVTQDDVVNCKPHPEIFLHAAIQMGVRPEKCLVFEDSLLGIEAAKSADMKYVLVQPKKPEGIASNSN
ncbi:MAG: hypothetical protein C5B43_03340 [Verrucomicrobia bacterium]|nr:MAG: hypothetical protein C5B43_03340 [Verrucomicrobiota bacterium]